MGRIVRREEDGFYHCSAGEWSSFRGVPGIKLIDGAQVY